MANISIVVLQNKRSDYINCCDCFLLCKRSEERYPFKKPWGLDVDHTAPLSDQRGSVLALAFADDLTAHKHWDQMGLWEPPHIGLKGGGKTSHVKKMCRFSSLDVILLLYFSFLEQHWCAWFCTFCSQLVFFAFVWPTVRQLSDWTGKAALNGPIMDTCICQKSKLYCCRSRDYSVRFTAHHFCV